MKIIYLLLLISVIVSGCRNTAIPVSDLLHNEDDTWEFNPFTRNPESVKMLDLRSLNENRAGEHGFIKLSPDGNSLLRGDGKPIRFWGVNMAKPKNFTRGKLLAHLDWLASMGCNLIRWNWVDFNARGPEVKPEDVDDSEINDIIWAVDEAANRGMYSYTLTGGALHSFEGVDLGTWGIEGYERPCAGLGWKHKDGKKPFGLIYVNETFRDAYKHWLRELLTRPNPETGIPLSQNPALAVIQFLSEDSLLFYTFARIPSEQKRILGRRYGTWLQEKYGSLEKVREAWGEAVIGKQKNPDMIADDWENGVVGFYINWQLTQDQTGGMEKRCNDQLEFFARTQRDVYEEIASFLKDELGCRNLIMAGNWQPAAPERLMDAERWTYTAGDIMGKNKFFEADIRKREKKKASVFADQSAMDLISEPGNIPWVIKHVEGSPFLLSATTYRFPNAYQIEAAFMLAAYGSLSGLEGVSWEAFYFDKTLRGGKAFTASPAQPNLAWTWPAAALAFRMGYIQEGETVLRENRTFDEMKTRVFPSFSEFAAEQSNADDFRPFFVGPVRCQYEPFSLPAVRAYEPFIDTEKGVVSSNTGELIMKYKEHLCTIDTPKVKAACGELGSHTPIELEGMVIECRNRIASVYAVSLDGKDIKETERLLIQVNVPAYPAGWQTEELGPDVKTGIPLKKIISPGELPWQVETSQGTVRIANTCLEKGWALDEGGCAAGEIELQRMDHEVRVTLPEKAIWVILMK